MSLLITALAASLSASAFQPADAPQCIQNPGQLLEADMNMDGIITRSEVADRRANIFVRLDRDGDGIASMEDAPRRMGRDRFTEALNQLLPEFDADGDGALERDEFVAGPTPGFDRADADGDDQLDAEELAALQALACDA
ncbi:EF-hand domain-containing protein [Maricaulaceae bacterium MS644]